MSDPDPAERYLSPPPPPEGLRARWREDRRSLLRPAAIVAFVVVAAVVVVPLAGGDGKGSGNLDRAFGGYISPADNDTLATATIAASNGTESYVDLVKALHDRDLPALARVANAGRRYEEDALDNARRLDNGKLRSALVRLLTPQREVFVAWSTLAAYALAHHRGLRAAPPELVQRVTQAEDEAQAAEVAYQRRLAFYMTPEQRRSLEASRKFWSDRVRCRNADLPQPCP